MRVLEEMQEPQSATSLAPRLGSVAPDAQLPPARARAGGLSRAGRGATAARAASSACCKVTSRAFVVNPALLGALADDPAQARDRFSSAYLMATATSLIARRRRARPARRSGRSAPRHVHDGLRDRVRISPAAFRAFTEDLASAVAALAVEVRPAVCREAGAFASSLGSHPVVTKSDDQAAAEAAHHQRQTPTKPSEEITQANVQSPTQDSRSTRSSSTRQIEAVWKAIADGEELTRWFVESAKVEPGVGGNVLAVVGRRRGGATEHQPDRCVGAEPAAAHHAAAVRHGQGEARRPMRDRSRSTRIERRDGKTVLRLVHRAFPNTPEWDGFYDGTNTRLAVSSSARCATTSNTTPASHGRRSRSSASCPARSRRPGSASPDPADSDSSRSPARPSRLEAARAIRSAARWSSSPPKTLELTLRELDDAFLAHSMATGGGSQFVYAVLSVFGKTPAEAEAIRGKWQSFLTTVLKIEAPPEGTAATC